MVNRGRPFKTGVYFLLRKGVVIYIGQSTRFPERMYYHDNQLMPYDAVRFIECRPESLDKYEQRWIKLFSPEFNGTHKPKEKKKREKIFKQVFIRRGMTFRKMTKKSTVGFGVYRDRDVQSLMDHGRILDLISMYYKLSHISFTDELLMELKITGEWLIHKPGVDYDKYVPFIVENYPTEAAHRRFTTTKKAKRTAQILRSKDLAHTNSKSYNQGFNHGHR